VEREQELAKLVNVLRRTSRMALQSEWTGGGQDAARFCIEQYNRVLARLSQIDEGVATVFEPLAQESSLTVAAMACRQLAAYYEDEVGGGQSWGWGRGFGAAYRARACGEQGAKDFTWKDVFSNRSVRDLEDLGEYIRESIEEWARRMKNPRHQSETRAQDERKTTDLNEEK
jgi:hypothetical protein